MKKLFFILILIVSAKLNAQVQFISSGRIEFEKRINLHNNMDNDSWSEALKKNIPKSKITYFDLYFQPGKTLYKPGKEVNETVKVPDWLLGPATDNIVYTNLVEQITVSKKNVFESSFLIQDSLRKVNWKITNETRTIAGFECRKAVGKILDSVIVIAFYTDQITVSGGPESFNSLPGMILGLAVPRMYATWYATKLELIEIKPTDIVAPQKGKKMTTAQLLPTLQDAMKHWGKEGKKNIWQCLL